jgi:hypothetical protein
MMLKQVPSADTALPRNHLMGISSLLDYLSDNDQISSPLDLIHSFNVIHSPPALAQ